MLQRLGRPRVLRWGMVVVLSALAQVRALSAVLRFLVAGFAVFALAACSGGGSGGLVNNVTKFSQSQYGAASPRVTSSANVPKGGGRYMVGQPYRVAGNWYRPQENPNYDETGIASWYGPNFHGRMTANGEVFDQFHLSAAHPTLPLPSYVRVQNLDNGRSVIVRVNDRGPFADDRLIDVSRKTAEVLGFINNGTAHVHVTYVGRAPLEGDDTQFLMASVNAPDYVPNNVASDMLQDTFVDAGRRPSPISREAGGLVGSFISIFSYADQAGSNPNAALNAATNLGNAANGPLPANVGDVVQIDLGRFQQIEMAAEVNRQFALLGAIDHTSVTEDGQTYIQLTMVRLKPGVLPQDVETLRQSLGL